MLGRWVGIVFFFSMLAASFAIRALNDAARARPYRHASMASGASNLPAIGFRLDTKIFEGFRYGNPAVDPRIRDWLPMMFFAPGVGVSDVNGDGFMDVLVVSPSDALPSHLYLNQNGKGFREAAAQWGLSTISGDGFAGVTPVFFDYDNDGRRDLFVAGAGCSRLFHHDGTRFTDVSRSSGATDCRNSFSALPFDYDNDGKLDLYVLRYWNDADLFNLDRLDFWISNSVDATNGGVNTLLKGDGNGRFEDVTASVGGADSRWALDATLADLDGDGTLDIYVANDWGADSVFAVRGGRLVNTSSKAKFPDRHNGMTATLLDLDASGRPAIYVSNINERGKGYSLLTNFLWFWDKEGRAEDRADAFSVDDCGWAWAGAPYDFNLDGRQDLYVANGMISGKVERRADGAIMPVRDYAFERTILASLPGTLSSRIDKLPKRGGRDYFGHQVDCVFLNHGDRFENVSEEAGITDDSDGRAAAGIDFANTGAVSLVLSTQNKGVHLVRNRAVPRGNWVGFVLSGTRSNRDGIGARVKVSQGGREYWRWSLGGRVSFLSTSDPRIHFGLPAADKVDVTVYWPSGAVQSLRQVPTGAYHRVREGS